MSIIRFTPIDQDNPLMTTEVCSFCGCRGFYYDDDPMIGAWCPGCLWRENSTPFEDMGKLDIYGNVVALSSIEGQAIGKSQNHRPLNMRGVTP